MDTQAEYQELCVAPKGQYRLIEIVNYDYGDETEKKECVYVRLDSPRLFEVRAKKRYNLERNKKWEVLNKKYFIFDDKGEEIKTEREEKKYVIKKDSSLFKFRKKYLHNITLPTNRCAFFEQVILAGLVAFILNPFGKGVFHLVKYIVAGIGYFFGKRLDEFGDYIEFHSYKWSPKKHDYDRFAPCEIVLLITALAALIALPFYYPWLLGWFWDYRWWFVGVLFGVSVLCFIAAGIIKLWPFIRLFCSYLKDKKNGVCPLVEYED